MRRGYLFASLIRQSQEHICFFFVFTNKQFNKLDHHHNNVHGGLGHRDNFSFFLRNHKKQQQRGQHNNNFSLQNLCTFSQRFFFRLAEFRFVNRAA